MIILMLRMIRTIILMLRMIILMGQDDGSWLKAHAWLMAHCQGGRPGPGARGSAIILIILSIRMIILVILTHLG